jgi:hypothetical protein
MHLQVFWSLLLQTDSEGLTLIILVYNVVSKNYFTFFIPYGSVELCRGH